MTKLTREQELYLIDLGFNALLDSAMHNGNGSTPTSTDPVDRLRTFVANGRAAQRAVDAQTKRARGTWTPERRAKFMATLAKNKRQHKSKAAVR